MDKKIFKVQNKLGIHVRVACEILDIAKESGCTLYARKVHGTSYKNNSVAEIKFPLALVAMQARFSESIEFTLCGSSESDENLCLKKIEEVLNDTTI